MIGVDTKVSTAFTDVRGQYLRAGDAGEYSLRNHLTLARAGWVLQSLEDGAAERIATYQARMPASRKLITHGDGTAEISTRRV